MATSTWSEPKAKSVAAAIIAFCVIASLFDQSSYLSFREQSPTQGFRRGLSQSSDAVAVEGEVYPWAMNFLKPLSKTPEPARETALFWHVPKSGGSTVKAIYKCMIQAVDIRSRRDDIVKGKELGVVQSGKVDLIVTSFPSFAVQNLYDSSHKGRALVMFRHPVDRLISKFFYLQKATWEISYRPQWKDVDLLGWVTEHNGDNNHMVKKLAGKIQRNPATELDLLLAKETIRSRFIVGLTEEMEESIQRFNVVMGIDDGTTRRHEACMGKFFHDDIGMVKTNSNVHPQVEKSDPAWQLLAEQNSYDIQLYEHALKVFAEQRARIDSYTSSAIVTST